MSSSTSSSITKSSGIVTTSTGQLPFPVGKLPQTQAFVVPMEQKRLAVINCLNINETTSHEDYKAYLLNEMSKISRSVLHALLVSVIDESQYKKHEFKQNESTVEPHVVVAHRVLQLLSAVTLNAVARCLWNFLCKKTGDREGVRKWYTLVDLFGKDYCHIIDYKDEADKSGNSVKTLRFDYTSSAAILSRWKGYLANQDKVMEYLKSPTKDDSSVSLLRHTLVSKCNVILHIGDIRRFLPDNEENKDFHNLLLSAVKGDISSFCDLSGMSKAASKQILEGYAECFTNDASNWQDMFSKAFAKLTQMRSTFPASASAPAPAPAPIASSVKKVAEKEEVKEDPVDMSDEDKENVNPNNSKPVTKKRKTVSCEEDEVEELDSGVVTANTVVAVEDKKETESTTVSAVKGDEKNKLAEQVKELSVKMSNFLSLQSIANEITSLVSLMQSTVNNQKPVEVPVVDDSKIKKLEEDVKSLTEKLSAANTELESSKKSHQELEKKYQKLKAVNEKLMADM